MDTHEIDDITDTFNFNPVVSPKPKVSAPARARTCA